MDLGSFLQTLPGDPRQVCPKIASWLSRSPLPLTDAWWHAGDVEAALEAATQSLARFGLGDALDPEGFVARSDYVATRIDDEEQLRRHQLGYLAVAANARLAAGGDARRFRCLGATVAWESGEPPWILVTPEEEAQLRALAGPCGELEAPYDGRASLDELPLDVAEVLDLALMPPSEAHRRAKEAFAAKRFDEVVALMPRAVEDGDHGVLAQLLYVEALAKLGRTDEAASLWGAIADEWLAGRRRVWDTQWNRLLALHGALGLSPADPRLELVGARAKP